MLINNRQYSPSELHDLTDGELLDLVYYVTENRDLAPSQAIAIITELLTIAKGGN